MRKYISVVVKPTLYCNLNCKHCYNTSEERVPGNMSLKTVENIMRLLSKEYESVWFIWHGGEPTTLSLSFYKNVIKLEERYFGKESSRYSNTIQTNGTLLDRRFLSYCRNNKINVGVSSEGPYNSVLRSTNTDKIVKILSKESSKCSISATISSGTVLHQCDIYKYFSNMGFNLSLSPVIPAGCAISSGTVPDANIFIEKSIEVFDKWLHDKYSNISLAPYCFYILSYLGDPVLFDCTHTSCLTKWLCINPDGSVYPCAKACPYEFFMGNVNDMEKISSVFGSDGFRKILIGSIKRREKCSSCEVYKFCNGGCSMDAYYESGIEYNDNNSCKIFKEIFCHIQSEIRKIIDENLDISLYNQFVRNAIINRLINPKMIHDQEY